jgi:hypothetical protein
MEHSRRMLFSPNGAVNGRQMSLTKGVKRGRGGDFASTSRSVFVNLGVWKRVEQEEKEGN